MAVPSLNATGSEVGKIIIRVCGEVVVTYYIYKSHKDEVLEQLKPVTNPDITMEYSDLTPAEILLYGK